MLPLLYFVIALSIGLFSNFSLTLSLFPCILRRLFTSSVWWSPSNFLILEKKSGILKKKKSLKKHSQKLNWFGWRTNMSRIPLNFYLPCSVMGRVYAHSLGGAGSRPESEIIFRRLRVSHFSFLFFGQSWLEFFRILIGMNRYRLKKKTSPRQEPLTLQFKSKQVTTTPRPNVINFRFIS